MMRSCKPIYTISSKREACDVCCFSSHFNDRRYSMQFYMNFHSTSATYHSLPLQKASLWSLDPHVSRRPSSFSLHISRLFWSKKKKKKKKKKNELACALCHRYILSPGYLLYHHTFYNTLCVQKMFVEDYVYSSTRMYRDVYGRGCTKAETLSHITGSLILYNIIPFNSAFRI